VSVRLAAWIAFVAGLVATTVLAAVLIPWHPSPGGTPATPPASDFFSATQIDRATVYSHAARWLARSELVVTGLVGIVLGLTPARRVVTAWLRGWWWLRVLEAVVALTLVGRLVALPFEIALQHRARVWGLSTQAWGGWLSDQVVGWLVTLVATALAVIALLGCTRLFRRSWPLVAGGLAAVLVLLFSFVYPVLVEPLTTHVTSLPAGDLRTQILRIADEEGVHVDDVLVTDASTRTTTLNAYVDGFGPSRRVVLYDNLVEELPRPEVLSVVAHELGHARHDDPLHGTLIGAAAALMAAGALGLMLGRRYDGLRDPRAVPALLALAAVASALALPVENLMSRRIETRADVAALTTTRDRQAFVDLQERLAVSSLQDLTPPGLSQWWFGSHPTALERIAVAEQVLGGQ
jgi:STE24 endopeptidase